MHASIDLQQCNACEALFPLNREVDDAWQAQGCVMSLQTGESWNRTVRPKAMGAWNMDAASHGLPALEHFIFFSSIVAAQGNAGAPTQRHTAPQPCAVSSGVQCCYTGAAWRRMAHMRAFSLLPPAVAAWYSVASLTLDQDGLSPECS